MLLSPYFEEKLDELVEKHASVISRRGKGLMQGLELAVKPGQVVNKGIDNGLLMLTAGENVLRLLPPLVIERCDIDKMCGILDKILCEEDQCLE